MRTWFILSVLAASSASFAQTPPQSLKQLVDYARKSSPVLRAARADLAASIATASGAKAITGPQVSVNGFATSGNNANIIGSAPLTDPALQMQVPPGTYLDGNLMLMVPLFATQLSAMSIAARLQVRSAQAELLDADAEVVLKVSEAYYRVSYMRAESLAAEAKLQSARELLRTTQARFESGKDIEASVDRVRAEVSRAEREVRSAHNEEAKSLLDLKQVMGKPLDEEMPLDFSEAGLPPLPSLKDWVTKAKSQRGLVLAARARIESADAEIKAARAQSEPKLYATGMADTTNRRDMGGVTVGLTLSVPLFDGGRIRSDIEKAKAMREKSAANLADTELTVEREVRQAYLDYDTSTQNLISAEAALKAAQAAYDVISLRVSAGKGILLEQLDALDTVARARTDLAQAHLDLNLSVCRLIRAAGGVQ